MESVDYCREHNILLTPFQVWACEYLERHGLRFCVDFGYGNAEDKAEELCGGNGGWLH